MTVTRSYAKSPPNSKRTAPAARYAPIRRGGLELVDDRPAPVPPPPADWRVALRGGVAVAARETDILADAECAVQVMLCAGAGPRTAGREFGFRTHSLTTAARESALRTVGTMNRAAGRVVIDPDALVAAWRDLDSHRGPAA